MRGQAASGQRTGLAADIGPIIGTRSGASQQTVADLAKSAMPGAPEASVTLLVNDNPRTVVSTGQLAVDLDETQYDRGHGPCQQAARSGEFTEIADNRSDNRWPDYMSRAAQAGNLSSLLVPWLSTSSSRWPVR